MKILIEQYGYPKEVLAKLLDPHYYSELQNGTAQIPYVGYFLSHKIPDTVFILPKVFIIDGKAFSKYTPESIIDFEKLEDDDKRTVFALSTWIYRAIKLYFQRKSLYANNLEVMQNVVSHHGANSETMIDIVLALLKFNKEHQNLFTYITRLKHSGQNKIHWQKTISCTQALIQDGRPLYLQPRTKQKEINFDEELIILFYSVLNYLNDEFHFEVRSIFGYELYKPYQVKDMIESGKGTRMLRQNRRKYFTDEMVQLWNLLFTFFAESQHVQSKDNQDEQAMLVRDFNLVFEDMIDSLIGDTSLPTGLKEQKDGKIIDHLYRDHSMIDATNDVYFIGDSKYYKEDNELGSNSIYKQFTYAKNVIQWNMDFFHQHGGKYDEGLLYRDEKTEGYNITPNFFIRGHIDKERLNDYSNSGLQQEGKEYISYHFENRLFDRDTLILQSYNINFLFVLAAYVQGPGGHKEQIRTIFRENIKEVLQHRYQFFAMTAHADVDPEQYLRENFQMLLGKVFTPFNDTEYYSLALDVRDEFAEENEMVLSMLSQNFFIGECPLGTDPSTIVQKVPRALKPAVPRRFLTMHWLENYQDANILIGCYKDQNHLDWIQGKNDKGTLIYNVRLDKTRAGALVRARILENKAVFVILYPFGEEYKNEYLVYRVHHTAEMKEERMKKAMYPNPQGKYFCYVFDEEISLGNLDINRMVSERRLEKDFVEGAPFFITGANLLNYRQ